MNEPTRVQIDDYTFTLGIPERMQDRLSIHRSFQQYRQTSSPTMGVYGTTLLIKSSLKGLEREGKELPLHFDEDGYLIDECVGAILLLDRETLMKLVTTAHQLMFGYNFDIVDAEGKAIEGVTILPPRKTRFN